MAKHFRKHGFLGTAEYPTVNVFSVSLKYLYSMEDLTFYTDEKNTLVFLSKHG